MNLYPNSKMPKWWPNWLRSKTVASVTVHKLEVTRENISRTKLLILEAEDTLERERTELRRSWLARCG